MKPEPVIRDAHDDVRPESITPRPRQLVIRNTCQRSELPAEVYLDLKHDESARQRSLVATKMPPLIHNDDDNKTYCHRHDSTDIS